MYTRVEFRQYTHYWFSLSTYITCSCSGHYNIIIIHGRGTPRITIVSGTRKTATVTGYHLPRCDVYSDIIMVHARVFMILSCFVVYYDYLGLVHGIQYIMCPVRGGVNLRDKQLYEERCLKRYFIAILSWNENMTHLNFTLSFVVPRFFYTYIIQIKHCEI